LNDGWQRRCWRQGIFDIQPEYRLWQLTHSIQTSYIHATRTEKKIMAKLTLATVEKRIAALQKTAEKLKTKDKGPAIKAILAMMAKHDISVSDLRVGGKVVAKTKRSNRKPVAAKYEDPKSGKTWTGRGRTPLWLAEAEAAGRSRDHFLIKRPAGN
jgi:DNA-binding protein H-NS